VAEDQLAAFKERMAKVRAAGGVEPKSGGGEGGKGFFGGLADAYKDFVELPWKLPAAGAKMAVGAADTVATGIQLPGRVLDAGLERVGAPEWLQKGAFYTNPINAPAAVRDRAQSEDPYGQFDDLARRQNIIFVNDKGEEVGRQEEGILDTLNRTTREDLGAGREVFWDSPGRTGARVADTVVQAATGDFEEIPYWEALQQGDLTGAVLEDVGNIATAGQIGGTATSAAAKAATRAEQAALATAAPKAVAVTAADRAAQAAGAVDDLLPATPAEAAAQATSPGFLGEALRPYAPQLRSLTETADTGTAWANRIAGAPIEAPLWAGKRLLGAGERLAPNSVGAAAEAVRQGVKNYGLGRLVTGDVQTRESVATGPVTRQVNETVDFLESNFSDAEQVAASMARDGWLNPDRLAQANALRRAQESGLGVDDAPSWGPQPEVLDVLNRWDEARTAPAPSKPQADFLTRMDEAQARLSEPFDEQSQLVGEGYGRRSPYDADTLRAQTYGNEAVEPWVQRDLTNDAEYQAARKVLDDAGAAAPDDLARAEVRLAERERLAREKPKNLPPEWRQAKQVTDEGRRAGEQWVAKLEELGAADLADELRATTDALPRTIDEMLDAGYERPGHVFTNTRERPIESLLGDRNATGRPQLKKTAGEYMRDSGPAADYTPRAQLGELLRRRHEMELNEAIRSNVLRHTETPPTLAQVVDETNDPAAVMSAMRRQGYEPVDPQTLRRPSPEQLDLNEGGTAWVPKGVFDGLEAARNEMSIADNKVLRVFDKGQGLWKMGVLPLNPRWLVNNVFGNSMLVGARVGAREALDPQTWAMTREAIRNPDAVTVAVMKKGAADADLGRMLGDDALAAEQGGLLRRGGRKVVRGSYKLNEATDNFAHVYLATAMKKERARFLDDLKKDLDDGAITQERFDRLAQPPEKMGRGGSKAYTDEQIIHESLKYAGDFRNLSKVERNVVRRALPFYPWMRHITKLAFSLPLDNPYRVVWTLRLSDMFSGDAEGTPDWLRGSIPLGGDNFLRSSFNPYAGVVGEENPFASPTGLLQSSTPWLQIPAGLYNERLGRTPTTGPDGETGFIGPKSAAGFLVNQFPVSRTAADLIGGPNARYQDRSDVTSRGRPIENNLLGGRWAAPVNFLTGASVAQPDLEEEARRKARKGREQARKR
jgi:hypothetical protein